MFGIPEFIMKQICHKVTKVLEKESSLLEIDGPVCVVGDLQGTVENLLYLCDKFKLHDSK